MTWAEFPTNQWVQLKIHLLLESGWGLQDFSLRKRECLRLNRDLIMAISGCMKVRMRAAEPRTGWGFSMMKLWKTMIFKGITTKPVQYPIPSNLIIRPPSQLDRHKDDPCYRCRPDHHHQQSMPLGSKQFCKNGSHETPDDGYGIFEESFCNIVFTWNHCAVPQHELDLQVSLKYLKKSSALCFVLNKQHHKVFTFYTMCYWSQVWICNFFIFHSFQCFNCILYMNSYLANIIPEPAQASQATCGEW